ncbi:hypothetical protein V8F20_011034 [Naviculisporaceae sp. PSN 640]
MKKLVKHFKAAYRDPARPHDRPVEEVRDPKFIVVNPPNPPGPYPPNPYHPYPYPAPAPVPAPYPDNKGLVHNSSIQKNDTEDVGTFSGFGSWMASFEPDPGVRGVVEVPGPALSQQRFITKVLSLAEGYDQFSLIRLTLNDVKTENAEEQNVKHAVVINGPWFMTLGQVNQLLEKHGYRPMVSAKHGHSAARNWDGDKALPTELQIPVIDGPSRYDAPPGEGPLMNRNEQFGTFFDNLRRVRVRCHEGKVLVTSYPAELEVNFNRTLRLPEDGKVHDQPIRLGKIDVSNIAGISKKLEASGSQSLVDMARKGGVFFPLYQREAMFLSFKARQDAFAVRVFVGGVNAVSGLPWNSHPGYKRASQDYLSVPPQQFLDGVCVGKDVVKQFIAMPLGSGYSVEKQVTGEETVGGMQLEIIPGNRWVMYVPASDHLPQQGHYYPEPDQRAGSLGVDMVVLGDRQDLALPGRKQHEGDIDVERLVDKTKFPVYMRQLYQSQVESSYHTSIGNRTEFRRGMHLEMTAVYMLQLTLGYLDRDYSQDETEVVNWAPWWTLERCLGEYEKLDYKAGSSSEPLREQDFFFRGRLLDMGSLSLQEQGVTDGSLLEVRQRRPHGHGYSHQYPDGKPNPNSYNDYPYPIPVQGTPHQYEYHQPQVHSYSSYISPPAQYSPPPPPPPRQQQPSYYSSHQESYGSPAPSYSSPHQGYSSSPSSAPSPFTPRPYTEQMPVPSFSPPPSSAQLPASAPPPTMSAPPPVAQVSAPLPPPSFCPPLQPVASASPPSSPGPSSYNPSQQSYFSSYEPTRPPASTSPPATSRPPRSSAPASSPPPAYESHAGNYPQQSAPAMSQPLPAKPHPKPQDQTGWAMGLAAGSKIHQAILADPFSPIAWRKDRATMLSVQILNSVAFESLTGMLAPSTPITPEMYIKQGLPFLKSYEEGITTDGSTYLAGIKGVGDIDAEGGGVKLGSNMAGGMKVGCTACGKMLCDSILRPCNHAFCSGCIKHSMTYQSGPGTFTTICRICSTRATKLVGFSAPMALPGEDVVNLSEAKVVTIQPFQDGPPFQSVHELPADVDFSQATQEHINYPPYPFHEMQA